MIYIRIIILYVFFTFINAQNWEPFHPKQIEYYKDIEIDYQILDNDSIISFSQRLDRFLTHEVIGYLPYWEYSQYPNFNYNLLTSINYFSAELDQFGNIVNDHNWTNLSIVEFAHERGVKVNLCATLFGEEALRNLLSNPSNRQNAINNLLNLVLIKEADGIDIDFELLPYDQRDNLVVFMQELSDSFHSMMNDPTITMATPAIDWNNAWDYSSLAEIVDKFFIMGYNYFYSGSETAGPVSPLGGYYYDLEYTIDDYLEKTNGQADKIILGLPYYGYDWPVVNNLINSNTTDYGVARTYSSAQSLSNYYNNNWDYNSNSVWLPYQDYNWRQCWYDDSLSLSIKHNFIKDKNLRGVGIWALGYDAGFDDLWNSIRESFLLSLDGDVNLDNEVNIQDIIIILNIIINESPYQASGDINNDNIIDILDIIIIIGIILDN